MKLLKLEVKNAFSFGTMNINFSELSPHTQIIGINLDEDFSGTASNGSGKTSIILCVLQALYGKDIKGTKKDNIANFSVNDGYYISVTFEEKGFTYKVVNTRNTKGKSSVSIYKNSVDISAHTIPQTYKLIESIIGIDYQLFTKLTYQSVNNYLDFLSITDSERKKLLTNLFNLDVYSEYIVKAKAMQVTSSRKLKAEESIKNKLITEIKIAIEKDIQVKKKPIDSEYKNALSNIVKAKAELADIDKINSSIRKHKSIMLELQEYREPKAVTEPSAEEIITLQTKVAAIKDKVSRYRKEVLLYNKKPSVCRLCKQPVDNGFNEVKLRELTVKIKELDEYIIATASTLDKLLVQRRLYENYVSITDEHTNKVLMLDTVEAEKTHLDYTACETKIAAYEKVITDHEANVQSVERFNRKAIEHNSKQATLLMLQEKAQLQYKQVSNSVDILKNTVNINNILVTALQKLLVYKLENMVLALQDRVNNYVQKLYTIDIALIISLDKDKLVFKLIKDGSEVEVSSLSSGELARIQVSVLFSIRDVLQSMSGVDVDVLVLDEILSSLDEPGREKLYSMLEEVPYKVLSISHSYKDNRLDCLTVEKKNGISTIKELV